MSAVPEPRLLQRGLPAVSATSSFAWSEAQAGARGRAASRDALGLLVGAIGAADATAIFVLSMVAFVLRHGLEPIPFDIITASAFASLLAANVLWISGAYTAHLRDSVTAQIARAAQAWTLVFLLLLTLGYLTKTVSEYSRVWAIFWYGSVVLGLACVRLGAAIQLRRWRGRGRLASTVAVVDLAERAVEFARRLARSPDDDVQLLGVFYADEHGPSRCGIADLVALSRLFRVDEVFILVAERFTASHPEELQGILRRLGTIPANVRICPFLPELDRTPIRGTALLHDIPMMTVHRRPLGAWSSLVKRAEDLLLGSLALIAVAPVMAVVAVAVKLDSRGPVLFRQDRQGFNNNIITVLKFRSMTHEGQPDKTVAQATRNDRRVTRVGRIIRRTSLDELPQLLNVLRGEMSLVGPRPHAVVHNQQYAALIDDYLGRHRVQPGITGWAQVNGLRGETDTVDKMQKRVAYDLSYIDNWSVALDIKILFLTAISLLFDRQAY